MEPVISRLFLLLVMLGLFALQPPTAQAHVLITDEGGETGAILHVSPDDDPIAGELTTLFFDIQDLPPSSEGKTATLLITDDSDQTKEVLIPVLGTTLSAHYVFPRQAVYDLTLSVPTDDTTLQFTHGQRVSRGLAGSALDQPRHEWAEAVLVLTICSFFVLCIIGFNRKDAIAKYSSW